MPEKVCKPVLDAAWGKLERPEKILLSSVATANTRDTLRAWCQHHWSLAPVVIQAQPGAAGCEAQLCATGNVLGADVGRR